MDGKTDTQKAMILHYVDEEPFTLRRNLVIYAIGPQSVDYREFFVSEEYRGNGRRMQMVGSTPLKSRPTDGRNHRAKDIEHMLKKECARKGKNIIKAGDMDEHTVNEMAMSHMTEYLKVYLNGSRTKA
jgi:hypothetical protein